MDIKKFHILHIGKDQAQIKQLSGLVRENFPNSIYSNAPDIATAYSFFIKNTTPDLLILDSNITEFNKLNPVGFLKSIFESTPILLACDEKNKSSCIDSIKNGAENYIILDKGNFHFKKIVISALSLFSDIRYAREFIA